MAYQSHTHLTYIGPVHVFQVHSETVEFLLKFVLCTIIMVLFLVHVSSMGHA